MSEFRRLKMYKPSPYKAPNCIYKERFADSAVMFCNMLKHSTGKWYGQQFQLIDWQERLIRDLFGIVRKYDENRQFRTAYIEIPKKNGKSELAAAVALLLTCTDMENRGEVYGCANDRQQASIVFDVAMHMVEQFPELKKLIKLHISGKRMTYKPLGSFYQVCSADTIAKDGMNVHGCEIMKTRPLDRYQKKTGKHPIIGTMASESERRMQAWLKTGCNAFEAKRPVSKPMSFWTEQDVLRYLRDFKIPYASVYGDIVEDEKGRLSTTGESRTGCIFCPIGCHRDKINRFQRLKVTHPKLHKYCMDALGLGAFLDYIGVDYGGSDYGD